MFLHNAVTSYQSTLLITEANALKTSSRVTSNFEVIIFQLSYKPKSHTKFVGILWKDTKFRRTG